MFFGTSLYSGIVEKNKDTFTSSIKTGEKSKELELPKALVALATAAVDINYSSGITD